MQEYIVERFRSHLKHLIKKVDTIIDTDGRPNKKDVATLTSSVEQCNERATLLKEVHQELPTLLQVKMT